MGKLHNLNIHQDMKGAKNLMRIQSYYFYMKLLNHQSFLIITRSSISYGLKLLDLLSK